jgi:nucleotide-binding universal stress UspA family protein
MYTKILLPTDGSALALAAAAKGVEFAHSVGAEVVAFFAPEPYQFPLYVDASMAVYPTEAEYKQIMRKQAAMYLSQISALALKAGVKCEEVVQFSPVAAEAIITLAKRKHCDLIFIGSHGRSGLSKLFLGSVAQKVIAACTIPVLVHRASKQELAQAQKTLDAAKQPAGLKKPSRSRIAAAAH